MSQTPPQPPLGPPTGAETPPAGDDPTTRPSHAPGGGRLAADLRTLRRSREDRVLAGVLGGLGRQLGVDPVVLRVVTVVLAFFGGAGLLLYALGWLLIPEEGEDASTLDQALGRGPATHGDRTPAVLLALLLGVVALASLGGVLSGSWDGAALLVLAGAGVVLLLRRRDASGIAPDDGDGPASPAAPLTYGYPAEDPGAAWAAAATTPQPVQGDTPPQPAAPAAAWQQTEWDERTWEHPAWGQPTWEQPAWEPAAEPSTAAPVAPPRRSRSALGLLTVSLGLLVVGGLAVLQGVLGLDVPVAAYVAAALGVVGTGLLIGTWFGRSRGLVWLGLLLALAMVPAVAADRFGSWQETNVEVQPTDVADLAGAKEYGGGQVVWDLTALELPDADGPTLTVDQGAGQLVVIVPPDADVTLDAAVGVGELRVFESVEGGFGNERSAVDRGADGAGGGTLTLDLELGIGQLEVRRAAA